MRIELSSAKDVGGRMGKLAAPGEGLLEDVVALAPDFELGEARQLPAEIADRPAQALFEFIVELSRYRELTSGLKALAVLDHTGVLRRFGPQTFVLIP